MAWHCLNLSLQFLWNVWKLSCGKPRKKHRSKTAKRAYQDIFLLYSIALSAFWRVACLVSRHCSRFGRRLLGASVEHAGDRARQLRNIQVREFSHRRHLPHRHKPRLIKQVRATWSSGSEALDDAQSCPKWNIPLQLLGVFAGHSAEGYVLLLCLQMVSKENLEARTAWNSNLKTRKRNRHRPAFILLAYGPICSKAHAEKVLARPSPQF